MDPLVSSAKTPPPPDLEHLERFFLEISTHIFKIVQKRWVIFFQQQVIFRREQFYLDFFVPITSQITKNIIFTPKTFLKNRS